MMRKFLDTLGSLTLGLWLMGGVALLLAAGSLVTGAEESALLNSMPLASWLVSMPLGSSWWLWITVALLVLLALNTILCSIDSLRSKAGRPGLLLRLAPQVMHAGFLLIVLAHLLSSVGGDKQVLHVREWSFIRFSDGDWVRIERLAAELAPEGYVTDFSAIVVSSDGRHGAIRPNEPFFFRGVGLYLKQMEPYPIPSGVLEIHREPGAGWALGGAILFVTGNMVVLARRRQDRL